MIIVFVILILVFSVAVEAKSKKSSKSKSKNTKSSSSKAVKFSYVNPKGEVRLLAHTNEELSKALSKGCRIVRDARTAKAVVCPKDVGSSLGLKEDMRMKAMELAADTQIGATTVHASGNTGAGRKIVILDSGCEYTHWDLSSSYLGGKDFVNDDNDPMDDAGHGTHVAGIITADGINDPQTKGVAPDAGIICGKVLDANGFGFYSDILAGIYWAVDGPDGVYGTSDDFKADAISMSLGNANYVKKCDDYTGSDMVAAVEYALSKNVLVVAGAGNEGEEGVRSPGCINDVITVGAVDASDLIADFSSRGRAVDVVAPGVNIYSDFIGSTTAAASGTSAATPMVSGTIALIKAAHPGYTAEQTADALLNTAIDLGLSGRDTQYGRRGLIDANAAVNYVAS